MTIEWINKRHFKIPAIELLQKGLSSIKMAYYPIYRWIHNQKLFKLKIINISEKMMSYSAFNTMKNQM
jgi:hypothetical protein